MKLMTARLPADLSHAMATRDHITICVCTFRRPAQLGRLLMRLQDQDAGDRFFYDIVVVDNDQDRSAQRVVEDLCRTALVPPAYDCEPEQNIALARNRAMAHAAGTFIAFIDDDEVPEQDWLARLYEACLQIGRAHV
jgi:succinoglycan biosynthesis protein ExoM